MDETAIATQQAAKIPQPSEPTVQTPTATTSPELTGYGNATIDLDEITQYKLHDLFDAKYEANDNVSRQQLQYIYENVSKALDNPDYPIVASKIRELMRIAGIAHSDRKMYKLYEWLKLSNTMKKTSIEMDNLRDE